MVIIATVECQIFSKPCFYIYPNTLNFMTGYFMLLSLKII